MTDIAKVFWSGRSQAVRLPKEYRFDTDRVTIRKRGNSVVLEPVDSKAKPLPEQWAWLNDIEPIDDDSASSALEEPEPQVRPELDDL